MSDYERMFSKIKAFKQDIIEVFKKHNMCLAIDDYDMIIKELNEDNLRAFEDVIVESKLVNYGTSGTST